LIRVAKMDDELAIGRSSMTLTEADIFGRRTSRAQDLAGANERGPRKAVGQLHGRRDDDEF
jgi:hypothetical protein